MERRIYFAAVVEKIMQQTGIRGIIVNNRITNVLRKKIGSMWTELKRMQQEKRKFRRQEAYWQLARPNLFRCQVILSRAW